MVLKKQGFVTCIEKMVLTDIKATEILVVLEKKQSCFEKNVQDGPGVQNGKPVRVLYSLPLFNLQNNVQ
jgi:hypothetical protein